MVENLWSIVGSYISYQSGYLCLNSALIMWVKLGFAQKDTNPLLKLALVSTTYVCVNFSVTHIACLALSSSRAVIKEELQWAVSQQAVSAQTSNSSLKNPLTSTQRPHSPLSLTPNLHPLPSLRSWLGSKLGLGIFHCKLSIVSSFYVGISIPKLLYTIFLWCLMHYSRSFLIKWVCWTPNSVKKHCILQN